MKIIFLDVDGVLITGLLGWKTPTPECVSYLNDITDATDAKIVVSSCWRTGRDVLELKELLAEWGVTGEVIDRTGGYREQRGYEIGEWLEKNLCDRFVIIDDDSDMAGHMYHLVRTQPHRGLQLYEAILAINHLTRAK